VSDRGVETARGTGSTLATNVTRKGSCGAKIVGVGNIVMDTGIVTGIIPVRRIVTTAEMEDKDVPIVMEWVKLRVVFAILQGKLKST